MFNKIAPDWNDHLEENFVPFWLDAEMHTSEHNRAAQKYLRNLNKNLRIFDNQEHCREVIDGYDKERRIVLIVSGRFGRELVPQVHQSPQLVAIYIYCHDKQLNEEWAKNFDKVLLFNNEKNDRKDWFLGSGSDCRTEYSPHRNQISSTMSSEIRNFPFI